MRMDIEINPGSIYIEGKYFRENGILYSKIHFTKRIILYVQTLGDNKKMLSLLDPGWNYVFKRFFQQWTLEILENIFQNDGFRNYFLSTNPFWVVQTRIIKYNYLKKYII